MTNKKTIREKETIYIASFSGGKDSLCMVLELMEEEYPLDYVVFFDTGMEFNAIYRNVEKITPLVEAYGAKMRIIKAKNSFLYDMLVRPICSGTSKEHYGFDWCGGRCRWATNNKVTEINRFISSLGCEKVVQYIGIAFDEPRRVRNDNNKTYPLVEWHMTESDCLRYCRTRGWDWREGKEPYSIDLYDILDRVSCWCCANKNLKELRNYYQFLPDYWSALKGLQSRIDRPFYHDKTIFELEDRFNQELSGRYGFAFHSGSL